MLTKITARGTLVIATDPAYPPQSWLIKTASRATETKCLPTEHTANEMDGFDIDTAVEISRRLGVEPCFVTPPWTQLTAGNWGDRWDISVGSMTLTKERLDVLYFTQPYYATPAALFVHRGNKTFSTPGDLSGKKVGACADCTYEYFLLGTLELYGSVIDSPIKEPVVIGYSYDLPALEDLALGDGVELDAVLVAQPTGRDAIKKGFPLKQLGEPLFIEYMAAAIDKNSHKNPISFVRKVSAIVRQMHEDGTLSKLSIRHYGMDFAKTASRFDMIRLDQFSAKTNK